MSNIYFQNNTPKSIIFDDVYFNTDEGHLESKYVFIDGNNLESRFTNLKNYNFTILETGFGTALNFMNTIDTFTKNADHSNSLTYIAIEKYPLIQSEIFACLEQYRFSLFDDFIYQYNDSVPILNVKIKNIVLTIYFNDINLIEQLIHKNLLVDAWFLDGFAPSKNPEMWQDSLFNLMAKITKSGGTFATFSAASFIRKKLLALNFDVKKLKGYGKKREMLSGVKL